MKAEGDRCGEMFLLDKINHNEKAAASLTVHSNCYSSVMPVWLERGQFPP